MTVPQQTRRPRIIVLFTDAGGGHRAAADALADLLSPDADVVLVNPYREALSHLDLFARLAGVPGEEVYNALMLRRGLTGVVEYLFRSSLRLNIRLRARDGHAALTMMWQRLRPDAVVSVMPWLNGVARASLAAYNPDVRFAVLITDMEETWPGQWFPTTQDFVGICGTDAAAQALHGRGITVHRTDGLLVRPAFLQQHHAGRADQRRALGLDPDRLTLCMLYGGQGSPRMHALAQAMRRIPAAAQAIFLCGRNTALADALRAAALPFPHVVQGFTDSVPSWLGLADVFVGKPGPGSMSEALALGVPVLLDASKVLPQERFNLRWAVDASVGETFADPPGFVAAVERFACGGLAPYAAAARGHRNRAAEQIRRIILALPAPGAVAEMRAVA